MDSKTQSASSTKLPDSIFGLEKSISTVHSVVKAYRSNRRQGTHATKTRSTVSGGGKKPFKQKGTGNARQGSSRSPLMEGGAVAHGPNPRSYNQVVNKKIKRLALKLALSAKAKSSLVKVVKEPDLKSYPTKGAIKFLNDCSWKNEKLMLILGSKKNPFVLKSIANIKNVIVSDQKEVNAESVLRSSVIFFTESALNELKQRLEDKV